MMSQKRSAATARSGTCRRRQGGLLPVIAVTEVSVCAAIFAALSVFLAFVPDTGDGAAGAAAGGEVIPIRRLELIGGDENCFAVLTDDSCLIRHADRADPLPVWIRRDDERVTAIAGSPAEPRLAMCRSDGRVVVLHANTMEPVWDRVTGAVGVSSATFSPDGQTLAVGTGKGSVLLLDGATGGLRRRMTAGGDIDVRATPFTPDGRHLIVPQGDGTASVRDVTTGEETRRLLAAEGQIMAMVVSPDGNSVLVGTSLGEIVLHRLSRGTRSLRSKVDFLPILALAFSADGSCIAVGSNNHPISLYSADALQPLGQLEGHLFGTRQLAVAGAALLSAGLDGRVIAWNVSTRDRRDLLIR